MPGPLLTEFQSACRAAHEQVQMLQEMYEHLSPKEDQFAAASPEAKERIDELRNLEGLLLRKLQQQDLLPTRPDPEREGLLEVITAMKATVTGDSRHSANERLAGEEYELLQHLEQMLEDDDDPSVKEARARTREAIVRLSGSAAGAGGGQ